MATYRSVDYHIAVVDVLGNVAFGTDSTSLIFENRVLCPVDREFMAGRSEVRRFVLQMLYLVDQNPQADRDRIQIQLRREFTDESLRQFGWSLFLGVVNHQPDLDATLSRTASNWRVERMATTDRNVLRLGLYEMTILGTPAAVVIDECIEIAREFGTENSPSFVNGILDKLMPAQPEKA